MSKTIVLGSALALSLLTTATASARDWKSEKVIYIDVGSEDTTTSKRDLEKRIYRLEKAVRQLQERVFELEIENGNLKDDNGKKFTCYIKTNSRGTFSSTQKSLTQAKADVMQKCGDVIKFGFECDEDKVKCGE